MNRPRLSRRAAAPRRLAHAVAQVAAESEIAVQGWHGMYCTHMQPRAQRVSCLAMNVLLLKAWIAEQGPALIGSRLRQVRQYDERTLLLDLASEDGPRTLLLSVMEEYPALAVVSGS